MKKLLISLICMSIISMPVLATENNKTEEKIKPDTFESILPAGVHYNYVNPINRPKWAYPLAWVGYVGTLFIVPFPIVMKNKDIAIAENNQKYMNLQSYKQRYNDDIDKCNVVFKTNADLYKCYQEVKLSHQNFINSVISNNIQQAQSELQRQQLQQQKYNNYLQYQNNYQQQQMNNNLQNINNYMRYGY